MRKIVVPLDGSAFAESSLPVALSLARRSGASLHLVQVAPPLPFVPDDREVQASREWAESYLEDVVRRSGPQPGLGVDTIVLPGGDAGTALAEEAVRIEADLIVMTTHGRGGFSRLWLGSVADRLLRTAPCPVLLSRPSGGVAGGGGRTGGEWVVRRMLVPLDGTRNSLRALEPATRLARTMDASVLLLRVIEVPPPPAVHGTGHYPDHRLAEAERVRVLERLEEVAHPLQGEGIDVEIRAVVAGRASEAVLSASREAGVDLVVMASRGRGGLPRAVLGSVTDKVVRGAEVAVAVVPPR